MTDPTSQNPSPRTNRAAAGIAFIGSGTTLVAVGLAVMDNIALAAAGFALMGVGLMWVIANRKAKS